MAAQRQAQALTLAPKIAVACSGLGHIQRGIEAWATDMAQGLRREGVDVTLFAAGEAEDAVELPCLRRTGFGAVTVAKALRHLGGWRFGFGSPYEVEQTSFSLALWRRIRHDFDILHVQDPTIALWLERAHRRGLSKPVVIYANGTGESATVMRRFECLQLLTPTALDEWLPQRPPDQSVFMIPNFVDTARFSPGDRQQARIRLGFPPDAHIVLCCAAIRRYHKRIDYLLHEFATAFGETNGDEMLVIAGGREDDTDDLIAEGQRLLGDRVRFMPSVPREKMPDLYRAADVFALASLHEMFGIVLLEAMATGLPVLSHDTPSFRAIVGPAGAYGDFSVPGGLAAGLRRLTASDTSASLSRSARTWVDQNFSERVVIREMISMYDTVLAAPHHG